jgi:glycine cleavage system H protein
MNIPHSLRYTDSHEWLRLDGATATIGITDHAQSELSDVVFVETPKPGKTASARDAVAVVESVKAASDIYAPVAGEIIEANPALASNPALINTDPYGEGWIFKMKVADAAQVATLKDAKAYAAHIGK